MLARIAAFEFRYQLRNPVLWVSGIILFLFSYGVLASDNVSVGGVGGNTHENGPFSIAFIQMSFMIIYMFVATAFVANVIVRDDDTGYGPIVRSTRITKFDYLFGRFLGAWLVAAVGWRGETSRLRISVVCAGCYRIDIFRCDRISTWNKISSKRVVDGGCSQ